MTCHVFPFPSPAVASVATGIAPSDSLSRIGIERRGAGVSLSTSAPFPLPAIVTRLIARYRRWRLSRLPRVRITLQTPLKRTTLWL